jgi:acylphosphatase
MKERLEAIITGKVQGVWFRDFARRTAHALGLTGVAKNLPDGTVQVIAEGVHDRLETLLEQLHIGPPTSRVERIEASWKDPEGSHTTFTIT